jgi:predicted RNA-binding Zn-ribbon protein involved in translation (DUF1610 family)
MARNGVAEAGVSGTEIQKMFDDLTNLFSLASGSDITYRDILDKFQIAGQDAALLRMSIKDNSDVKSLCDDIEIWSSYFEAYADFPVIGAAGGSKSTRSTERILDTKLRRNHQADLESLLPQLIRRAKSVAEDRTITRGTVSFPCPKCGTLVDSNVRRCGKCHTFIPKKK